MIFIRQFSTRKISLLITSLVLLCISLYYAKSVKKDTAYEQYETTAQNILQSNQADIISERSKFTKVYEIDGKTKMMRISNNPIHFKDSQNNWQEIDTTIKPVQHNKYKYGVEENAYKVYFSDHSADEYIIKYENSEGSIEFGLEQSQSWGELKNVTPIIHDNEIIYKEIYPGISLRYVVTSSQFLEEFIVTNPSLITQINKIEKRFRVNNIEFERKKDGSISFSQNGQKIWEIPQPVLYEHEESIDNNYGVYFTIEPEYDHYKLTKVITPEGNKWLQSQERTFPLVIDDTINLDSALSDGTISKQGSTYTRTTNNATNFIGFVSSGGGSVNRAYLEWATSSIPNSANILSVGLYLRVSTAYTGHTVDIVQSDTAPSVYTNNNAGNQALFDAISLESTSGTTYVNNSTSFQTTGAKYLNLGYDLASTGSVESQVITDLESKLAADTPFALGFIGTNETTAFTNFQSAETGTADFSPDLIVFYDGIEGYTSELQKPLRNSFFDGSTYWTIFNIANKQYTFYSTDASSWAISAKFSDNSNTDHGLWFEPPDTVWGVFSQAGTSPSYTDLYIKQGIVSGTSPISWSAPVLAMDVGSTEAIQFPSIIRDTNDYCWVMGRYVNSSGDASIRVVRSKNTICSVWTNPVQDLYSTSRFDETTLDYRNVGGYIVPLTGGKVYATYKSVNTGGATGILYGRQFTSGSSFDSEETIDSSVGVGVYNKGMSMVGIGDTVHLIYVDSDGSLMYTKRTSSWSTPIQLVDGTSTDSDGSSRAVYSPSLSVDTSTNKLYAIFRTDTTNEYTGEIRSIVGTSPYTAGNWSSVTDLTTSTFAPQSAASTATSPYNTTSNYSSNGVIFATFVDGFYGIDAVSVLNSPGAPTVSEISPDDKATGTLVASTAITGTNFIPGASVTLTAAGKSDINATNVTVNSNTSITASFSLSSAETGTYNVVVTNPDSQSATLSNGFTVTAAVELESPPPDSAVRVGFWLDPQDYLDGYSADISDYNAKVTSITMSWNSLNPAEGVYNWTNLHTYVNYILSEDPQAKILLHIRSNATWATQPIPDGNPYTDAEMPATDISYWNTFLTELATEFSGSISMYTISNEAAVPQNWGAGIYDQDDYATMLQAMYTTIKATDPNALVTNDGVSSGVTMWNYAYSKLYLNVGATEAVDFLNDALEHHVPSGFSHTMTESAIISAHSDDLGTLSENWWQMLKDNQDYIDTLSIHWYQKADNLLEVLPWIQTEFPDKPIQLWETALGWDPSGIAGQSSGSYDLTYQAQEVWKLLVQGAAYGNWVQLWPWTSIVEDIPRFPVGVFDHQTLTYRPAADSFKAVATQLYGSTYVDQPSLGSGVHAFRFSKDSDNIYALWSDSNTTVSLPLQSATIIDITNTSSAGTPGSISVSSSPVIVIGAPASSGSSPTPTPTPSSSSSSSTSSSSTSSGSPPSTSCSNTIPSHVPELYEIRTTNNSAILYIAPAGGPYTDHIVTYGYDTNDERFATSIHGKFDGAIALTINYLSPNTTYYFKVKANNGCGSSPWGNQMEGKTTILKNQKSTYYKNIFKAPLYTLLPKTPIQQDHRRIVQQDQQQNQQSESNNTQPTNQVAPKAEPNESEISPNKQPSPGFFENVWNGIKKALHLK